MLPRGGTERLPSPQALALVSQASIPAASADPLLVPNVSQKTASLPAEMLGSEKADSGRFSV